MGFSEGNDAQALLCVVYTFKFMYECNLNGDCCHARTCHFMQQLNTFIYSIRNYGNSFSLPLLLPYLSLFLVFVSRFLSTSFGLDSEIERVVNELSTSVYRSAAFRVELFFCLINHALHIVGLPVCFHLPLTEFPFEF